MRAPLPIAILLLSGCDAGPSRAELLARVERLHESGTLPRLTPGVAAPAESLAFRAALREIDAALEEVAPLDAENRLRRSDWGDAERLATHLPPLARFFADVEALSGEDFVQEALAEGRSLGFRSHPLDAARDPLADEPWHRPELSRFGHWTTLLSARAIQLASEPGGGERAADLLAWAFDLSVLIEDGSLYGFEVRRSAEWTLVDAVRIVDERPGSDPAVLRARLDARLARATERERVMDAIGQEIAHWTEMVAGSLTGAEGYARLELGAVADGTRAVLIEGTMTALDDLERVLAVEDPCRDLREIDTEAHRIAPSTLTAMRSWHSFNSHLGLARFGLAVSEHRRETGAWPKRLAVLAERFDDGLPPAPCRHRRFALRWTETELVLSSAGRRGAACRFLEDPWRWPAGRWDPGAASTPVVD